MLLLGILEFLLIIAIAVSIVCILIFAVKKNRKIKRFVILLSVSFVALVACIAFTPESAKAVDNGYKKAVAEKAVSSSDVSEPVAVASAPEPEEEIITVVEKLSEPSAEPVIEIPEPVEEVVSNPTPEVEPIDTGVTYEEIYTAFKRNELAAKDKYNGNVYQITAKINGMETSGLFNLTGGATLTMETRVDKTIVFFLAEFEKEQEEGLKKIEVGDTITFTGECRGGTFSDCEIIN